MPVNASKRFLVIRDYCSPYPAPIIFREGEEVAVGQEFTEDPDWKDWVWCQGEQDNQAWVPKGYLAIRGRKGIFIKDYNALELSVTVGERLRIHEIVNGFGMGEKPDGTHGWVPMKVLEPEDP
jgi:hypothetical protein